MSSRISIAIPGFEWYERTQTCLKVRTTALGRDGKRSGFNAGAIGACGIQIHPDGIRNYACYTSPTSHQKYHARGSWMELGLVQSDCVHLDMLTLLKLRVCLPDLCRTAAKGFVYDLRCTGWNKILWSVNIDIT